MLNGILYSNGDFEKISIIDTVNERRGLIKHKKEKYNLKNNATLTFSYVNDELLIPNTDIKILCGDGSLGGDGFVLAASVENNEIFWLVFLDDANPFLKLEYHNDFIIVINNLNEKWKFEISDKSNVRINII